MDTNNLRHTYENWKRSTNERQKLQWIYALVVGVGLIIAGLIGLVDRALADNLLQVVYAAGVLLIVNFVVWAILTAFIGDARDAQTSAAKKPAGRK